MQNLKEKYVEKIVMPSLANSTFAAFVVHKYTHEQFKLFLLHSWTQVLGGCVYIYQSYVIKSPP